MTRQPGRHQGKRKPQPPKILDRRSTNIQKNTICTCSNDSSRGGLRQGVVQGKRVLTVYDRACVDFDYCRRCQKACAVYFLSRVKDGMVFEWLYEMDFDLKDPRNAGVQRDDRVHSKKNLNLPVDESPPLCEPLSEQPDLWHSTHRG
ncbi:hypothetical protein N9B57_03710 [Verrucomicrobia bacterium]|nr:hypothetical protein [Verrucomicrobiota bacterium]MDA7867023.1 hypothetical protein [Verrucomicrobiota bacterium]